MKHGAKVKACSHEGCTNYVQQGGVCIKHGVPVKNCIHDIAPHYLSADIFCTSLKALVMAEVGAHMERLDGDTAVRGCHVKLTAAKEATLTSAA